jgi:CelD/BcsL family acetyltransferase involved in cellulose biosynthesis
MAEIELVAIERSERERVRDVWLALEARAQPTYFLSWGWIETWLDMLPHTVPLTLYVAKRGREPIAAFFLGARTAWRHRVMPSRGIHLNQTGSEAYDEICIEYNGFLSAEPPPLREIVKALPMAWDELHLPALDAASASSLAALSRDGLNVKIDRRINSPFVELERVRGTKDYATLLGKNTRAHIRKSIRLYEARGKVQVEVASTVDRAMQIFDELVKLHRQAWQDRGEAGAFIPFVHAFHERLIRTRFASGEIQLSRVHAGDHTIGCLYSFLYRGDVLFYQCGFTYEDDPKLKPGMVCHFELVRHNASIGQQRYDFLAGDRDYKKSFATSRREMIWARVQKPRLRFALEDLAKTARDVARALRTDAPDESPKSEAKSEDQ